MTFAEFTFANGHDRLPVYINPNQVVAFHTSGGSGTLIYTSSPEKAQEILVAENALIVVSRLKEAASR